MKRLSVLVLLVFVPVVIGQESAQQERDEVCSLAAYSFVLKDWQTSEDKPGRGHNIGSVLVDPDGNLVFAERNCNFKYKNSTQHGEVRLMIGYLRKTQKQTLKGYTIYTTLEPCAMCSGMMTMVEVKRTVYGQTDPDFGKALERLQFDSSILPAGYRSYPRAVASERSSVSFRTRLDSAYAVYRERFGPGLTGWLRGNEARGIYKEAEEALQSYKLTFCENAKVLGQAKGVVK